MTKMTQSEEDEAGDKGRLIISEIVRWCMIVLPLYLSVWRYARFKGYTEFIPDIDCSVTNNQTGDVSAECMNQYWGIFTAIVVGGTLIVYIPLKCIGSHTVIKDARYSYGW